MAKPHKVINMWQQHVNDRPLIHKLSILNPKIMKIYIKNMVSNTCKLVVKDALNKLNLHYIFINLGEVEVMENISKAQRDQLKESLQKMGLELMNDKKTILIERVKDSIVEMILYADNMIKVNFSEYLSEKLDYDYTYLSNLFSEVQGTNIQNFVLLLKVERVKELITYDELTISEIAYKMNYSSVAHLSNQFKKVTGFSPTYFKHLRERRRNAIEAIA
jgi:AraC-like DNA-binding protein